MVKRVAIEVNLALCFLYNSIAIIKGTKLISFAATNASGLILKNAFISGLTSTAIP